MGHFGQACVFCEDQATSLRTEVGRREMVQSVVCRLALAFVLIGLVGFAPASIQAQEAGGPSSVEIVPNVPHSPVSLALSPDRRMLLSGGYDGSVKLWDFATGRLLRTFLGHSQKAIPRNSTSHLSPKMLVALSAGLYLWVVHGVLKDDLVIMRANSIGETLSLAVLASKILGLTS
jgi:WD40 repeat protein